MEAPPQVDLPDGPISVSLCHDEMLRLPDFLRHHREIGVRHFIVVDNASTDGFRRISRRAAGRDAALHGEALPEAQADLPYLAV